jgi:hypothetical protein
MTPEKMGSRKKFCSRKKFWFQKKFDSGEIFDGPVEGAATMPSAELDTTRTRLRSTYTTDAAYPVTFMQHGNAANPNLARPQYGGSVSSPASLLCMGLFLRKFIQPPG